MNDQSTTDGNPANLPEFTVSELSGAIKRTIEDAFGFVRVRGEIGRVSRPGSGHIYLDLKDEKAVLNGVIWKGQVSRLRIKPEQGLEVICTGRLTTFGGQSRYQMIIESMEPAGVGALMALLDERRKKLAAEGLFSEERKKPLPYLPEVIGVVTSPSGAVIRDILHRLSDRFPRHVLIWPTLVQGGKAAEQIAGAIKGFNNLPSDGPVPRPDVLIVARGGGSIEDLWAFNEEIVVRAAAASKIPLISAVGHETDTTLIDYVADQRAPTPTAAAEMAVPVRSELIATASELEGRLTRSASRLLNERAQRIEALARALPRPSDLIGLAQQKCDAVSGMLHRALRGNIDVHRLAFARVESHMRSELVVKPQLHFKEKTSELKTRLRRSAEMTLERASNKLTASAKLLDAYSYTRTLERGFVLVHDQKGQLVRRVSDVQGGAALDLEFSDGHATAIVSKLGSKGPRPKKSKKETQTDTEEQGRLL